MKNPATFFENNQTRKQKMSDDDDIIPKEMLAPLHLWASDSEDDQNDNDNNNKDNKSRKSNYLAPFVATPFQEANLVIDALKRNSLLLFPSLRENNTENCYYSICDIGCGDGSFLGALRDEAAKELKSSTTTHVAVKAFGIDIDEEVIETAKKNFPNEEIAEFHVADVCSFRDAEEMMIKVFQSKSAAEVSFDGLYLYLYPDAMKQIEGMILQLIEYFATTSNNNKTRTLMKWIVTRRWNFGEDHQSILLSQGKIKLIEVVVGKKKENSVVPFFVYKVL